jgi:hypothetical protein
MSSSGCDEQPDWDHRSLGRLRFRDPDYTGARSRQLTIVVANFCAIGPSSGVGRQRKFVLFSEHSSGFAVFAAWRVTSSGMPEPFLLSLALA